MAKTHSNFIRSQAAKAKQLGVKSGIGGGSMKAAPPPPPMGSNSMADGGGFGSGQNAGLMPVRKPKGGTFPQ
jgi:hypothetical protein